MADSTAFPKTENSIQAPSTPQHTREPIYNDEGKLYCNHLSCQGKNQTFKRPSEWKKHMDKHERPYKCTQAECQRKEGFTWFGGLVRHEREVHKIESAPKKALFCPFPECGRSSGRGFTRKDNLEQHKKNKHSGKASDSGSDDAAPPSTLYASSTGRPVKRRKYSSLPLEEGYNSHPESEVRSCSGKCCGSKLVQDLRDQLRQKDNQIQQLQTKLDQQTRFMASIPQAVFFADQGKEE